MRELTFVDLAFSCFCVFIFANACYSYYIIIVYIHSIPVLKHSAAKVHEENTEASFTQSCAAHTYLVVLSFVSYRSIVFFIVCMDIVLWVINCDSSS